VRRAWAHGANYDRAKLKFYTAQRGFILGEGILGVDKLGGDGADVELPAEFTSLQITEPVTVESGLFVHREVQTAVLTATLPERVDLRNQRLVIKYDGALVYKGTIRQYELTESVDAGRPHLAGNTATKTYRLTLTATAGDEQLAAAATPARVFDSPTTVEARVASWTGFQVTRDPVTATDLPVNTRNVGWTQNPANPSPFQTVYRKVTLADSTPQLLETIRSELRLQHLVLSYTPWQSTQIHLVPANRWVNDATSEAGALVFTDNPAVLPADDGSYIHSDRHISYTQRQIGDDPSLYCKSAGVKFVEGGAPLTYVYGPYRTTDANPQDVMLDLGVLVFGNPSDKRDRLARNLIATLPLRRTPQPFTRTLQTPFQSLEQLDGILPGMAVLEHDGTSERIAVLGRTHSITPTRWTITYATGPRHLIDRQSEFDPGTPGAGTAVWNAGSYYVTWVTPSLPQDTQLYRRFYLSAVPDNTANFVTSWDSTYSENQMVQTVSGEVPGTPQAASFPAIGSGLLSGTYAMWVSYTSNPLAGIAVPNFVSREGQPQFLGLVTTP
jgi:hypothetical protein